MSDRIQKSTAPPYPDLKKSRRFIVAVMTFFILTGMVIDKGGDKPNFTAIKDVTERKQAFVNYLKPLIKAINAELKQERQQLKVIYADLGAGKVIDKAQRDKLKAWAKKYHIKLATDDQMKLVAEKLFIRMDQLPASMVLAQAAMESAWGTSRFVKEGNNYFGQWCYKKGCGIVPKSRTIDAKHEVRKFENAKKSLIAYFRNINTHPFYKEVRKIRAQLREQGKPLSGLKMVAGLKKYSQRGQSYIDELRAVIRFNQFE